MLPSTLVGLVLFVVLLTPGFIYDLRLDRVVSRSVPSQLREILRVVTASLLCNSLAFALLLLVRISFPRETPSISSWIKKGNSYWQLHDKLALPWAAAFLALACVIAFVAADKRVRQIARPFRRLALTDIHQQSAWSKLFHLYDDYKTPVHIYAGCQMDDGSYISGPLFSVNKKVEETADRELILMPPILVRTSGGTLTRELVGVGFVTLSARNIKRLDVTHFPDESFYPRATENSASPEDQNKPRSPRNGLTSRQTYSGQLNRRLSEQRKRGRL